MSKQVSILLPTRSRPEGLRRAIESFVEKTHNYDNIEILLKVDIDDIKTLESLSDLPKDIEIKALVNDRMSGYKSLHIYMNELARMSTGHWLMPFNDDAQMMTKNWDILLHKHNPLNNPVRDRLKGLCVIRTSNTGSKFNCFPIVSRTFYETLGYLSQHNHYDWWINTAAIKTGCLIGGYIQRRIKIEHTQTTLLPDDQKDDLAKEIEETLPGHQRKFRTLPWKRKMYRDVRKLKLYLGVVS